MKAEQEVNELEVYSEMRGQIKENVKRKSNKKQIYQKPRGGEEVLKCERRKNKK